MTALTRNFKKVQEIHYLYSLRQTSTRVQKTVAMEVNKVPTESKTRRMMENTTKMYMSSISSSMSCMNRQMDEWVYVYMQLWVVNQNNDH